MPNVIANPFRGIGLPDLAPRPSTDARAVEKLLEYCPAHAPTPLLEVPKVAEAVRVGALWAKDERARMGLGSFKALGAAYAIAREAAAVPNRESWQSALAGRTYVTASAGNHGLSVATGARVFGAEAVVYLADTVPDAFARRLESIGARPVRAGAHYEASMDAAARAAEDNGWSLLSDSSWPGYTEPPYRVMEGYLQMASEAASQMPAPPSHILLQAGVGGMAAAVAAHSRQVWGDGPVIAVVEPEVAPALFESIRAGRLLETEGPASNMGRLDCKTPSMIALAGLAHDADLFVTITEDEGLLGQQVLAEHGIATTPSGAAGIAALAAGVTGIDETASVLVFVSEGPEDG